MEAIETLESEYRPTFRKDQLSVISSGYDNFSIGIVDHFNRLSTEMPLVTIKNVPGFSISDQVLDNIKMSIEGKRLDFPEFKKVVLETVGILFDGKAVASFANEGSIDKAIECMDNQSFETALDSGEEVFRGVCDIFNLNRFQTAELLKELRGKLGK